MKIFSAFVHEGLENGDAVRFIYQMKKVKQSGLSSAKKEHFMPDGKLDYKKALINCLGWWTWAKNKGYKHIRDIEDYGVVFQ